jgi:hypothetical protein
VRTPFTAIRPLLASASMSWIFAFIGFHACSKIASSRPALLPKARTSCDSDVPASFAKAEVDVPSKPFRAKSALPAISSRAALPSAGGVLMQGTLARPCNGCK